MVSVGVIEKALSFLYVQSSCWICVMRKGVRFRLERSWGVSRISHLLFLWGLRCDDGAGWSAISKVGLLCIGWVIGLMILICWMGGVIICARECLCCMVVVASYLWACGAVEKWHVVHFCLWDISKCSAIFLLSVHVLWNTLVLFSLQFGSSRKVAVAS